MKSFPQSDRGARGGADPATPFIQEKSYRPHDYGPWHGLTKSYRCVRCGHRVPAAFAPFEQPECTETTK